MADANFEALAAWLRGGEPGEGGKEPGFIGRQAAYDQALLAAVAQGDAGRALTLIRRDGANPNARDRMGVPALTLAAKALKFHGEGRLETLVALIEAGSDVNALNAQGESALAHAAMAPSWEAAQALLAAGAKPFEPCSRGWAPIHRAAERGAVRIVEALLKAGSPADEPNDMGETPLMIAAFYDEEPAVRALLAAGADPDREDGGGLRAIDLSRDRNGEHPQCEGALTAAMEASALRRETAQKSEAGAAGVKRGRGKRDGGARL